MTQGKTDFLADLHWRGLVDNTTPEVEAALAEGPVTAYIGFDPSAASLHIGSMLPVLALARFQKAGHRPVALVGGGTGLVGDPSGRTAERQLLSYEEVDANIMGIKEQLSRYLDFGSGAGDALLIDNGDWLRSLNLMEFLRDYGKHFSVNQMMARESVKRRLEQEEGISFTEFTYMLLQAYDYLELHDRVGCTLQMGGSDQWGNILSGADLIRRVRGTKVHGLVMPLVTRADGTKFGKSEGTNIWLDASLTSPYRFYQYWLNTDDRDVVRYLKYFTWLEREAIDDLELDVEAHPERREAQRLLAEEVTRITHGSAALERAKRVTGVFFGGAVEDVSADDLLESFDDAPSSEITGSEVADGLMVSDLLSRAAVAKSRNEARRLLKGGGIYLNNRRVESDREVTEADGIEGRVFLVRKGKKSYHLVRVVSG